jgi:hypothetical protein
MLTAEETAELKELIRYTLHVGARYMNGHDTARMAYLAQKLLGDA